MSNMNQGYAGNGRPYDGHQNSSNSPASLRGSKYLEIDKDCIPYKISTKAVERYFRDMISSLKSKFDPDGEMIKFNLISIDCTDKSKFKHPRFVPFLCEISINAEDNGSSSNSNSDFDSFFNPEANKDNGHIRLKKWFNDFLNHYTYTGMNNKNFRFTTDDIRRSYGISRQAANIMNSWIFPRYVKNNNGSVEYIAVLLDPLKIFYDMLRCMDGSIANNYNAEEVIVNEIEQGQYIYKFTRRVDNRRRGKNILSDFERMLNANR